MSRLILAVAVAAIVLLVGAFVPVKGRTLVERWNAAPSASQFAERGWNEVVAAWDGLWGVKSPARTPPKATAKAGTQAARPTPKGSPSAAPAPEPVEHHTEADRDALDRIVAEHAKDPRPARR
jgi:hypothetical protein